MTFDIHAARPEEAEAVLEILGLAFGLDIDAARPIFYADPYYDLSHKRVLSLPGVGIVSCLTIVPTEICIGGVPVRAGGIAGVATRPAFQRRGYAAALLEATVPVLAKEFGFPLSLLHPIDAPFYQKFGWEYASRHVRWLSAPVSLPQNAEAERVRPATADDWPAIRHLHETLTCTGTGTFRRDTCRWLLIQMPVLGREAFVYETNGEISGYIIWERHDVLHLLEMLGATVDTQDGLLGFLARQPDALVEWTVSPEILSHFGLSSAGLTPEPGVTLRVVDLKAALSTLHSIHFAPILAKIGTTLTIIADDPQSPQNSRLIVLTPDSVIIADQIAGPWLRIDIRTLARLYTGDLLPSEAAASGAIFIDSPQTLALADRLFPLRQPYVAPLDQF
ncbi:MAG: GNAT family N-acetyltransferase [Janthinobacterium lividum]